MDVSVLSGHWYQWRVFLGRKSNVSSWFAIIITDNAFAPFDFLMTMLFQKHKDSEICLYFFFLLQLYLQKSTACFCSKKPTVIPHEESFLCCLVWEGKGENKPKPRQKNVHRADVTGACPFLNWCGVLVLYRTYFCLWREEVLGFLFSWEPKIKQG